MDNLLHDLKKISYAMKQLTVALDELYAHLAITSLDNEVVYKESEILRDWKIDVKKQWDGKTRRYYG